MGNHRDIDVALLRSGPRLDNPRPGGEAIRTDQDLGFGVFDRANREGGG
jgi:hypothetical protein